MRFLLIAAFLIGIVGLVFAQRTVTGTVTDKEGNPITSVNVSVIGTSDGAITDVDGKYRVNVPDDYSIIRFSGPGVVAQEIQAGTQTVIDITMKLVVRPGDDDVMRTGMGGGVSKEQNTGNISQVLDASDFSIGVDLYDSILVERRREFLYEGMLCHDVRRLEAELNGIPLSDDRFILPIPQSEQDAGATPE